MRRNLTFLLFLCSLCGFAQLYVQEGTVLILSSSDALLSSQETHQQINTALTGKGTLLLNSTSVQQLSSTQAILELPTLHIKNANLVSIQTALILKDQLILDRGVLQLTHTLILTDFSALVLGKTAGIHTTPYAQLRYTTQLTDSLPLAGITATTKLLSVEPILSPLSLVVVENTERSQFGMLPQMGYDAYFQRSTPPPKAV